MSIQVFILCKLIEGNNYPYKLKKLLSHPIPFDEFGGLTESKLYYHFDSLAKHGFIETVEVIKEDHRPDKQVFGITNKGREELPKKIYKLFENAVSISDMLVGIAYIKHVDRDQVVKILEKNLKEFMTRREYILDFEKQIRKDQVKENFLNYLQGYYSSKSEHTIYWLEELIKQIQEKKI